METRLPKTDITFEQLPAAVTFLISEIADLKRLLQLQIIVKSEPEKRQLIGVYKAAKVIGKSIGTLYNLTSSKKIPFYKDGNQLYFFEDELLSHISNGKNGKKTKKP